MVALLFALNISSYYVNSALASSSNQVREIILVDKNGNTRFRVRVDEAHDTVVQEFLDKSGNVQLFHAAYTDGAHTHFGSAASGKISLSTNKNGEAKAILGEGNISQGGSGIEFKTHNYFPTSITMKAPKSEPMIFLSTDNEQSGFGVIKKLSSKYPNPMTGVVVSSGTRRSLVSIYDKGKQRVSLEQEYGTFAGLGVGSSTGEIVFASGVNETTQEPKHIVKKDKFSQAWEYVSHAMTAKSLADLFSEKQ